MKMENMEWAMSYLNFYDKNSTYIGFYNGIYTALNYLQLKIFGLINSAVTKLLELLVSIFQESLEI